MVSFIWGLIMVVVGVLAVIEVLAVGGMLAASFASGCCIGTGLAYMVEAWRNRNDY